MKVCIVGTAWPYRGGLSAMNERLAKEFVDQGHEVEVITFTLQYPSFLFPGKSQFDDRPQPPFTIKRMINSVNPFNWFKVGNYIKDSAPDLVIVKYWIPFMGPCFGTILRLARHGSKMKVVSILDNLIPHEKRPMDMAFSRYFVKAVDGFITLSKSVLNDINEFDQVKPRKFSPHPVYDSFGEVGDKGEARKNLGLDPEGKYILFFGFIRDYKGLDMLLEAMADDRIKNSNVKLMVAGEYYSNEEKYQEIINRLGISDRLELFTQFIPDNEIGMYFNAADCVVQPYKTATQSGVTQIAYHFEKPMIVTNVGGLPEIVPDGQVGYVCEVNPTSIADSILKFYDADVNRFSLKIKEKQKEYSWATMINNVFTVVGM
ncbi:MAG: glycosyltransferase [Flavobacteriales bacterium]